MKIITVEEHFMSSKVNDRVKEILLKNPDTDENMFQFVDQFVQKCIFHCLKK